MIFGIRKGESIDNILPKSKDMGKKPLGGDAVSEIKKAYKEGVTKETGDHDDLHRNPDGEIKNKRSRELGDSDGFIPIDEVGDRGAHLREMSEEDISFIEDERMNRGWLEKEKKRKKDLFSDDENTVEDDDETITSKGKSGNVVHEKRVAHFMAKKGKEADYDDIEKPPVRKENNWDVAGNIPRRGAKKPVYKTDHEKRRLPKDQDNEKMQEAV